MTATHSTIKANPKGNTVTLLSRLVVGEKSKEPFATNGAKRGENAPLNFAPFSVSFERPGWNPGRGKG